MGQLGVGAACVYAFPSSLVMAKVLGKSSKSPASTSDTLRNKISPESLVMHYNNFYEFSEDKEKVWHLAKSLQTQDWTLKVEGLVRKPRVLDVEDLIRRMPVEERIYRLRCVETWAAIIPWQGFPLRNLIQMLDPLPSARFVTFKTFLNPNIAPGQKSRFWEPWPYTEGLSMPEAM
ncbi:MAG: molybdopterin-dependent oxidoreductase, partial [Nitrospinota bacterium]|nr:molybdopterin-dependent oxidoreductase [Nitrospinota bacterium]